MVEELESKGLQPELQTKENIAKASRKRSQEPVIDGAFKFYKRPRLLAKQAAVKRDAAKELCIAKVTPEKAEEGNTQAAGLDAQAAVLVTQAVVSDAQAAVLVTQPVVSDKQTVLETQAVVLDTQAAVLVTQAVESEAQVAILETQTVVPDTQVAIPDTQAVESDTQAAILETQAIVPGTQVAGLETQAAVLDTHYPAAEEVPVLLVATPLTGIQKETAWAKAARESGVQDTQLLRDEAGSVSYTEAARAHALMSPASREREIKAKVADLLVFIPKGCSTADGVTWLLGEALRMAVQPDDHEESAAAEALLSNFKAELGQRAAEAKRLLQGGAEQLQEFDKLPPVVRGMCASERVTASLRQRLAALEKEEAVWLALKAKYEKQGFLTPGESQSEPDPASPELHVNFHALSMAHQRAAEQVPKQVEALHAFLSKAEYMVATAQKACSSLQTDYRKEQHQLQSLIHVDSPQALLKILSQAAHASTADVVPSTQ